RVGEPEHDDQVEDRHHAQDEREAAHAAGGQQVQHHGGDQVDRVGGEDGAFGAVPPVIDPGDDPASLPDLVPDALEVDDEGVGGERDRHDEAHDAGQAQSVPDVGDVRQHGQRAVGEHPHQQQARGG